MVLHWPTLEHTECSGVTLAIAWNTPSDMVLHWLVLQAYRMLWCYTHAIALANTSSIPNALVLTGLRSENTECSGVALARTWSIPNALVLHAKLLECTNGFGVSPANTCNIPDALVLRWPTFQTYLMLWCCICYQVGIYLALWYCIG